MLGYKKVHQPHWSHSLWLYLQGPSPHPREAAWESPNRDVIPNDGWHILEIMGVKATDREEEVLEFLSYILECPIKPYIK